MVTFEGLEVNLSASTRSFKRALESAQDKTRGLNFSLERLGSTADDAEGELDAAGRSALTTSGMFSVLTVGTTGLTASFVGLSTSVKGTVAALGALLAISGPLISAASVLAATLGGLALGFGTVIGAPIVTNFKLIKNELQAVGEELQTILQPLGDKFLPLLLEGIRAIPDLFRETLAAAGGFEAFAETLSRLGSIAFEVIPGMVAGMLELGRQALPALEALVGFLKNEAPGAFSAMQDSVEELAPEATRLGEALAKVLPPLLRVGTDILDLVLPAMTLFVENVAHLMRLLSRLTPLLRGLGDLIEMTIPPIVSMMDRVTEAIVTVIDKFEKAIKKARKLARLAPERADFDPTASEVDELPEDEQRKVVKGVFDTLSGIGPVLPQNQTASGMAGGVQVNGPLIDAGNIDASSKGDLQALEKTISSGLRDALVGKNVGVGANRGG